MDGNQKIYRLSQRDNPPTSHNPNISTSNTASSISALSTSNQPSTKITIINDSNQHNNTLLKQQQQQPQTQQKIVAVNKPNSPITSVNRPASDPISNDLKKLSDNNNNNNNNNSNSYFNSKKVNVENEETDNDDATSPFNKTNNDMINLSTNENDLKPINRKSRGKSLFKSIFCCFTPSLNRRSTKAITSPTQINNKNSSFIDTNNFSNINNENNNNNNNNLNNQLNTQVNANNNFNSNNLKQTQLSNNNNHTNSNLIVSSNSNSNNNNSYVNNDNQNLNNNNNNNITNIAIPVPNQYNTYQNNTNSYLPYTPSPNDNIHQYLTDKPLLPPIRPSDMGKKCLIIDLDETLVHSSFKQVNNADFIVPVEIDGTVHQVYVLKRPHVDEFLKKMGQIYECVLFTASLAKYADPVANFLDKWGVFRGRLFREACVFYRGNYVKDLSRLGRDLNKTIILDNSPASYIFHPDNAVPCTSWFDDMHDTELLELIPHFERLAQTDSVYSILKQSNNSSLSNSLINHNQTTNNQMYMQQEVDYDEHMNQQVPMIQQQSIIYQQQQQQQQIVSNPDYNNDSDQNQDSSFYSNNKYLLKENKILLSIDLNASKQ